MSQTNNTAWNTNYYFVYPVYLASVAVATDLTVTVPFTGRHKLVALSFTFTTDVNAADRLIHLYFTRGAVDYQLTSAGNTQGASLGLFYHFLIGGTQSIVANSPVMHAPLPDSFLLETSDSLKTSIDNIQAGDQLTDLTFIYHIQPFKTT